MRINANFTMTCVPRLWAFILVFCLVASIGYAADRHYIEQSPENTHIAIFVHGFTGDYLKTWGKLPALLQAAPRLDKYDLLFWGYPSRLFRHNEDISTTGQHLKTEIDYLSKPYEKIVLIGHSMGGLVIRSYIVQALIDGKGSDLKAIADVMLFGVPNEGDLKADFVPNWVNDQISDLGVASAFIIELRKDWIQRVTAAPRNDDFHQQIPTVAVAGYQDQFVHQESVVSFFRETAMTDGDHRSMVKPETTSHLTYRIIHRRLFETSRKPPRRTEETGDDIRKYGVSEERFQKLSEEHGVTKSALKSFFKILEQRQVPLEDLDSKLREIAASYKELLTRLQRLDVDDPEIAALRQAADTALRAGDLAHAEHLLNLADQRGLDVYKTLLQERKKTGSQRAEKSTGSSRSEGSAG